MGGFPTSGKLGVFTLPQWLGLPAPVVVVAAAALALGAFRAATAIERLVATRRAPSMVSIAPPESIRVVLGKTGR